MRRFIIALCVVAVLTMSFVQQHGVYAQTATPTPSTTKCDYCIDTEGDPDYGTCYPTDTDKKNKTNSCGTSVKFTLFGTPIPTFGKILSQGIKLVFFIAGLLAIFQMLSGAIDWINSGGDEKKTGGARQKIQAAVVGLILLVLVLVLAGFLEQVVFGGKVCLGITCDIKTGNLRLL